jgi:hypothetical protein
VQRDRIEVQVILIHIAYLVITDFLGVEVGKVLVLEAFKNVGYSQEALRFKDWLVRFTLGLRRRLTLGQIVLFFRKGEKIH